MSRDVFKFITKREFETVVFSQSEERYSGVTQPSILPCPNRFCIDAARNMNIERWDSLDLDVKFALANLAGNTARFFTVMPSLEGKIRHLKKYDRQDQAPPRAVQDAFSRVLDEFPRVEFDEDYLLACDGISHVEAFRERWSHLMLKGAGVEGERFFGKPVKKQDFLSHPLAESVLEEAMGDALAGSFRAQPMRAAGRAKVLPQSELLNSYSDPNGSTIDRLIWISPPTSLHVSTPGAKTMSRRLSAAAVSSYGLSPFYGGAQRMYERFGYCGSVQPTGVRKALSDPVISSQERHLYVVALKKHRKYFIRSLFGMGSDVKRMDSSMREWWIKRWAEPAYRDAAKLDEFQKKHMTSALVDCHCGGTLAMEADLLASVPEGATTGSCGISTLESTYRWIGDLLGVTLNLQWEVIRHLRKLGRSGQAVPDRVVNLADPSGRNFLYSERVAVRPENHTRELSAESDARLRQRILASSRGRRPGRAPSLAFWPLVGPETPLFEHLLPIVAYYHNCLVNGDDDWNTFPLLEMVPEGQILDILSAEGRCRILTNRPKVGALPRLVIGTERMTSAFGRLRLPTVLNADKGIEGRGIRTFLFNSMKPVWSAFDGAFSFAINGISSRAHYESFSHPDDMIRSATHSALRMIGLVLLSPDPRHYQMCQALYDEIVAQARIPIMNGRMDISAHLEKEAKRTLYSLLSKTAPDSVHKTELQEGWARFPMYSEVLILHGFNRSALFLDGVESFSPSLLISQGFPIDPDW
jgi:hypothetical protein